MNEDQSTPISDLLSEISNQDCLYQNDEYDDEIIISKNKKESLFKKIKSFFKDIDFIQIIILFISIVIIFSNEFHRNFFSYKSFNETLLIKAGIITVIYITFTTLQKD